MPQNSVFLDKDHYGMLLPNCFDHMLNMPSVSYFSKLYGEIAEFNTNPIKGERLPIIEVGCIVLDIMIKFFKIKSSKSKLFYNLYNNSPTMYSGVIVIYIYHINSRAHLRVCRHVVTLYRIYFLFFILNILL